MICSKAAVSPAFTREIIREIEESTPREAVSPNPRLSVISAISASSPDIQFLSLAPEYIYLGEPKNVEAYFGKRRAHRGDQFSTARMTGPVLSPAFRRDSRV